MKKIISLLLAFVMVMSISAQAMPRPMEITVYVDDAKLEFDVAPTSENGRTLVPMRYIFEALGAEVKWIGEENKVVATKGNTSIELILGSNIMLKNGEEIILDVPAKAIDGRTLVPVRAISEALDAKVNWNGEEYKVDIRSIVPNYVKGTSLEVAQGFLDAISDMDFVKALDYVENGEEVRAKLPEGTYAEIVADAISQMTTQGTGALTGADTAIKESLTSMLDEVLKAYASKTECRIIDTQQNMNGYTYTVSITMPAEESLNKLSTDIDVNAISTEITTQLVLEGKISPTATEGEVLAAVLPAVFQKVAPELKNIVLEAECETITDKIIVTSKNAVFKVSSENLSETVFDISALFE